MDPYYDRDKSCSEALAGISLGIVIVMVLVILAVECVEYLLSFF